jgi:hypothetical protein
MGKYLSLSGSLLCSSDQIEIIKEAINDSVNSAADYNCSIEQASLYLKCWYFPDQHVNWTSYVFFGGDIRSYAEDYIIHQLLSIIERLAKSTLEERDIAGQFNFTDEEGRIGMWIVDESGVRIYDAEYSDSNDITWKFEKGYKFC